MAPKGYTTVVQCQAHYGQPFSAAQAVEAQALLEPAEQFLDHDTGRSWGLAPITDESHTLPNQRIWLFRAPVTSIQAIHSLSTFGDDAPTALVADTDYELRNPATGEIYLPYFGSYYRVLVDYTPAIAIPALVELTTARLVLWWLRPMLTGEAAGITSYSVGGELSVTYADVVHERGLPPDYDTMARKLKRKAVFA